MECAGYWWRYLGFGLVQCFGSTVRVMSKQDGTKMFKPYEEVYVHLNEVTSNINK